LPNSREAESEADSVGMRLAAYAGFDPRAAVTLWEKMLKVSGSGTPELLSTHPSPETRIQAMRALADKYMPVYQQSKL
jgi:predicted Zn-dependent protease